MKIIYKFESPRGTEMVRSRTAVRQTIRLIILLVSLLIGGVTASHLQNPCKPSGWNDAMLCCRKLGPSFSLPIISSEKDYEELVSNMKIYKINNIWLPLKRIRYRQFTWMDGTSGPEQLDNIPNSTNCGKWNFKRKQIMVGNCGNYVQKGVLCQVTDCPGCRHIDISSTSECVEDENNCYIKDCTSTTWDGGRHFCLEHSSEYLSLSTPDKIKAFQKASSFKTRNCLGAWIGLRRQQWTFIRNMSEHHYVILPYWLPGEPVPFGDCGYMGKHDHGYGWAAASCDKKLGALCVTSNRSAEHITTESTQYKKNETLGCQPCVTGVDPGTYTQGWNHLSGIQLAILGLCTMTTTYLLLISCVLYKCLRKGKHQGERRRTNEEEMAIAHLEDIGDQEV